MANTPAQGINIKEKRTEIIPKTKIMLIRGTTIRLDNRAILEIL
jgi:hypothetical protein